MEELNVKCTCGNSMKVDAGDSIVSGNYRWYLSCHCDYCKAATEMDGHGINDLPKEVEVLIIKQHGEWRIHSKNKSSKMKIKYVLNKMSIADHLALEENDSEILVKGSKNEIKWINGILESKKITDYIILSEENSPLRKRSWTIIHTH